MNEDRLRRWVRGELPPGERREVSRWIVRCTDPDLGPLLHGILRSEEEARADAKLGALGGLWTTLVERWQGLVEHGAASFTALEAPLTLASLDESETTDWLRAHGEPDPVAEVDAPIGVEVALYLTADDGNVSRIAGPGTREAVTWSVPVPATTGDRPTLWALRGASLPRRADAGEELVAGLAAPSVEARALRWLAPER